MTGCPGFTCECGKNKPPSEELCSVCWMEDYLKKRWYDRIASVVRRRK